MDTTATQHVESHAGRHRKDPFLELPDDTQVLKQTISRINVGNDNASKKSLFLDIVLTPVYAVSFILSLIVVERQQRQWRLSQHAQQPQTLWERWFSSPEPYQEAPGATWAPHYSWKRRGVAKMQINDVFEMKGRVAICMAFWSVLIFLGSAYATRRMYFWLFN